MKVFRPIVLVDGELVLDDPWPSRSSFTLGDVVKTLIELDDAEDPAPVDWWHGVRISEDDKHQVVSMSFHRFLSRADLEVSMFEPVAFSEMRALIRLPQDPVQPQDAWQRPPTWPPPWLWLYRSALYVTDREPRSSEMVQCALLIKALAFREDESFRRLREEVANYEAVEKVVREGPTRQTIPDDVKLLVWARDGGSCVRCGSKLKLHFDHVIPFSQGGADTADNLQLLCQTCNLSKSDRIV